MVKLKQVRLINWYGFSQITVPVGFFTLIAGKNGNGKSVFLDAVKYAMYGDTVFNKSTENKGSRTVSSYTRGLLDATAGTYIRPADKMPNVYTHIVLEMEEVELERCFILGVAIDTDSSNGFKTQRYVMEQQALGEIVHTYEREGQLIPYSTSELQKTYGLKMMDVKIVYKRFLKYKNALEDASRNIEIAARQITEYEERLEVIAVREREKRAEYYAAKDHLNSMDCRKAILNAEEALHKAQEKKEGLGKEKEMLLDFQTKVSEWIAWFTEEQYAVKEEMILSSLTEGAISKAQKESSVAAFLADMKSHRDEILSNVTRIRDALRDNQRKQDQCQQIIDECEARKTTFSEIPDYVALKNEINREFEKRGIRSEASFACEYVLGLTDEAWRDSIEGYLGRRRYTILVEPEYYDIADDVLNASKNRYAHLFNTKLLMKKRVIIEEDSVVQFIEVKNQVAKQYFQYQLGRFQAVAVDKVRNYENAMSKEGRVSVAMDSYFLRFDRIRFYCLGQESLELNRIKAVKQLEHLKETYREYQGKLSDEEAKEHYLDTQMQFFGEYNYDVCREYEEALLVCSKKESELKSLEEAQKNNMEYMELAQRVAGLELELKAVENERDSIYDKKSRAQTRHDTNKNDYTRVSKEIGSVQERLKEYETENHIVYTKATEDYDKFVTNEETGQAAYNASRTGENQLPMTDVSIADYQDRRSRIWMDDREEILAKLKDQTKRYEEIFKNEFVLTVLNSCESARDDLKLINAELARLEFKSNYAFQVKYVKDGSDYEKILEYARYLKERAELGTTSGQMTLESMTVYSDDKGVELEQDIKKIINCIVENNDKEQIEHYADYRNYMTYEILLTNDVLTKAKLSKQSGYNSGAEVQIPYMLILLSALLMIYNDKNSSTRLVFIDEPFAKMDPTNVMIMLRFMKEQNLQMIFCAPDKTELIGNECDVILPVLRTRTDLMEMGMIEMHKGV